MNWLESLLYGIVSGITEFLPISSFAHEYLLLKLFGVSHADPLQSLLVHLALIVSVFSGCSSTIVQMRRARQTHRHNKNRIRSNNNLLELRFLKNAVLPLIFGYFILSHCIPIKVNVVWIAAFSFVNFLILIFQSRMMQGNKDERMMSVFDSFIIGLSGAVTVFPGISRVGAMLTVATLRGIGRNKAIEWAVLLSVPALALLGFNDILGLMTATGAAAVTGNIIGYILSTIGAYAAGHMSILLIKTFTVQKDFSAFAYYSLGIMMFALFLYLSVV